MTKASDNAFPSLLITEGTEPSAPAAGKQRVYIDSTTHHLSRTNSSGTEVDIETGAGISYTAWTPALTASSSNPTLGSGSNAQGRYFKTGKFVHAYGSINFGSSGVAAGSGVYWISTPVTMRTSVNADMNQIGMAYLFDSSASALRVVNLRYTTTTTVTMLNISTNADVTNAVPWTWAASDALIFQMTFEAA
jgi:hypothetical protein